ncbi:hypothetical protein DJ68_06485, partial [Halorubrum sp. C3]
SSVALRATERRRRSRRRHRRSEHRERRGAQRACVRLAAGALAVFAADPPLAIYKRAAGALAVFAADPLLAIYKRVVASLEELVAESSTAYKHPAATPLDQKRNSGDATALRTPASLPARRTRSRRR